MRNIAHQARMATGQRAPAAAAELPVSYRGGHAATSHPKNIYPERCVVPLAAHHDSRRVGDARLACRQRHSPGRLGRPGPEIPEVTEPMFDLRRGHLVTGARVDRQRAGALDLAAEGASAWRTATTCDRRGPPATGAAEAGPSPSPWPGRAAAATRRIPAAPQFRFDIRATAPTAGETRAFILQSQQVT